MDIGILNLQPILALLAAVGGAMTAYTTTRALFRPGRGAARAMTDFAGVTGKREKAAEAEVGSEVHKVRLFFARWNMDVAGNEETYMLAARAGSGIVLGVALVVLGFPTLTFVAGLALGWMGVGGTVNAHWRRLRLAIEKELPTFLSRMAGTIQADPNVLDALDDVVETLEEGAPLQSWLRRFLRRMQSAGREAMDPLLTEAHALSPSLGLAMFQIKRLWETGGAGYTEAFSTASANLGGILEGRATAAAKADSARGAIRIILLALVGVTAVMTGSAQMRVAFANPIVQLAYLIIVVWVGIGWWYIDAQIDDALS